MLIFPPCKIFFLFASLRRKIRTHLYMWTIFIIHDLPAIALLHCELFRYITRSMFLISFSNIPVNYFLIHQPIVFLYERGLLIYIIYLIRLISFLCSCVNFFIIPNLPAGALLVPWLWFFLHFIVAIPMFNIKDHLKSGLEYQGKDNHSQCYVKHKIDI